MLDEIASRTRAERGPTTLFCPAVHRDNHAGVIVVVGSANITCTYFCALSVAGMTAICCRRRQFCSTEHYRPPSELTQRSVDHTTPDLLTRLNTLRLRDGKRQIQCQEKNILGQKNSYLKQKQIWYFNYIFLIKYFRPKVQFEQLATHLKKKTEKKLQIELSEFMRAISKTTHCHRSTCIYWYHLNVQYKS